MPTIAVLTSSDAGYAGTREDISGKLLIDQLSAIGSLVDYQILPDDYEGLTRQLVRWIDQGVSLVATTGGTGLGPRDVMPEVTRDLVDRWVPGIAEAMRAQSLKHTPMGMLSRGVAGIAKKTLIINFPGSPKSIEELGPVVLPVLPHALDLIAGKTRHENRSF